MVATRKTVGLHSSSYSQMPAQEMWQREAEEAEEEASEFQPLTMPDGSHLRLQLGTSASDDASASEEDQQDPNMPLLLNQRDEYETDEEEEAYEPTQQSRQDDDGSVDSQTPSERENIQNAFLLGTQTPPDNDVTEYGSLTQRTAEGAQLLLGFGNSAANNSTVTASSSSVTNPPEDLGEQPQYSQASQLFPAMVTGLDHFPAPPPPPPAPAGRGGFGFQPMVNPYSFKKYNNQRLPKNQPQQQVDPSLRVEQQWQHPPQAPTNPYQNSLAFQVAQHMEQDGLAHADLSAKDQSLVDNCKSGGNSADYMAAQARQETQFFKTLREFGGPSVKDLLEQVVCWYDPNGGTDYAFYNIVGGPKDPCKKAILNKCLVLCALKWKHKDNGKPLQPNTFSKYMQQLFYVFSRKGVRYDFKKDFDHAGGFQGIIQDKWKEIRKTDSTFGVNPNRKRVDSSYLKLLRKAIEDGVIKPYEDPLDCLGLMIFTNGFFCGLRGREEHADLPMDAVRQGTYTEEQGADMEGLEYNGLNLAYHKAMQLKLTSTSLPPQTKTDITYCENPFGVYCPVKFTRHFLSKCHPDAKKFYGAIATPNQREEYKKKFGRDIWFCPSDPDGKNRSFNLGHNMIQKHCMNLAKKCGLEGWEKCTGHALRALMITHTVSKNLSAAVVAKGARHKSLNSQLPYNVNNGQQESNRQTALNLGIGGNSKQPPKKKAKKLTKKESVESIQPSPPNNPTVNMPSLPELSCEALGRAALPVSCDAPGGAVPPSPLTLEIQRLERKKKILELKQQVAALEGNNTHYMPPPPSPHYPHSIGNQQYHQSGGLGRTPPYQHGGYHHRGGDYQPTPYQHDFRRRSLPPPPPPPPPGHYDHYNNRRHSAPAPQQPPRGYSPHYHHGHY